MRERDGSEFFGADDLRGQTIGVIDVNPEDDRQSVLTAIMTQEKLGRRQTVLILPARNRSFWRPIDFEGLKHTQQNLQTQIIVIAAADSRVADYARQQRFPVFVSLERYVAYAQSFLKGATSAEEPANASPVPGEPATETAASEGPPAGPAATSPPPSPAGSAVRTEAGQEPVRTGGLPPLAVRVQSVPPMIGRRLNRVVTGGDLGRRVVLLLLLCLLVGGGLLLAFASLSGHLFGGAASAASVTIVPDSRLLKSTYTLTAQPGTPPNPARRQVDARFISSPTLRQSLQASASGHGITPATQARGTLTFYNALTIPQQVPAGTILTDNQGVQVITDQLASLQAAQPPLEASTTVPAHAVAAGTSGNIPPFAFKVTLCCATGITVQNPQAFSGGQDPQPYTYLQQSDIDHASATLQTTLAPQAQQALESRILPGERLVAAPTCFTTTTADHQAGDHVARANVSLAETCTAEVYDQVGARTLAAGLLAAEALQNPGPYYRLTGQIVTSLPIILSIDRQGALTLRASAEGLWVYQIDGARLHALAALIRGKSLNAALTLLKQQPGIRGASIMLSGGNGSTLPESSGAITLRVAPVTGLQASPLPTTRSTTPTAPVASPTASMPTASPTSAAGRNGATPVPTSIP